MMKYRMIDGMKLRKLCATEIVDVGSGVDRLHSRVGDELEWWD